MNEKSKKYLYFKNDLTKLVNDPTNKYVISCTILGIVYIAVFNIIGYYAFKKAEIK